MKAALLVLAFLFAGPAHASDRLPKSMLGKYASDPQACAEQSSEAGMKVEPRSVMFYEHSYEVRRIVRRKDGSLNVSGFYSDLDGRARASIVLKQIDADTVQAGEQVFHRCKNEKPK